MTEGVNRESEIGNRGIHLSFDSRLTISDSRLRVA
jgi:hypothetical protein